MDKEYDEMEKEYDEMEKEYDEMDEMIELENDGWIIDTEPCDTDFATHISIIGDLEWINQVVEYYMRNRDKLTSAAIITIIRYLSEIDEPNDIELDEYISYVDELYSKLEMQHDDGYMEMFKISLAEVCRMIDISSKASYAIILYFQMFSRNDIEFIAYSLIRYSLNDEQVLNVYSYFADALNLCPDVYRISYYKLSYWIMWFLVVCKVLQKTTNIPIMVGQMIRPILTVMILPNFLPKLEPTVSYILLEAKDYNLLEKVSDLIPIAMLCFSSEADTIYCTNGQNFESVIKEVFPHFYNKILKILPEATIQFKGMKGVDITRDLDGCESKNEIIPAVNYNEQENNPRVGLVNMGNTCYLNSVLQALVGINDFIIGILAVANPTELLKMIQQLFVLLIYSKQNTLSPDNIIANTRPSHFVGSVQQDSSEYLSFLLETLHTEEQMSFANENSENNANELTQPQEMIATSIDKSFGGKTVVTYQCVECLNESKNTHPFRELQLSFPMLNEHEQYNIQQLIDYYCMTEMMNGDNQYLCKNCKKHTDAKRLTSVAEAPNNLILTLKFCQYNRESMGEIKILHKVLCDPTITLNVSSPDSADENGLYNYELTAVIIHTGTNMNEGHYYTLRSEKNKWFMLNDESVSNVNANLLQNLSRVDTPYMLFYKKHSIRKQNLPNKLIKVNSTQQLPISELPRHLLECVVVNRQIQKSLNRAM